MHQKHLRIANKRKVEENVPSQEWLIHTCNFEQPGLCVQT
jgi:hypothetical protein